MNVSFPRAPAIAAAALAVPLAALVGPAAGTPTAAHVAKPTIVLVTAGKPTEFAFKLSKRTISPGKVVFRVTNRGKLPHSFEICTSAKGGTANKCKGKSTPVLATGKSATITVTLKKGKHEYLCTVTGHAAAGMKGILGAGVAAGAATVPTAQPTPLPTATVPVTPGPPPQAGPLIGDPTAGAGLFQQAGCGSCHTLKAAAGANGTAGPNLDQVAPDEQTVITNVTFGNAMGMPAFSPQFNSAQIQNIAAYVYTSTHH
jgi:mono/diheme cytochrome c family protein